MLPGKRKPVRSGIARAPERVWKRHRAFVRSHECVTTILGRDEPGRDDCEGAIQFAHVSSAANGGMGLKAFDWFGVPLCVKHHAWSHKNGAATFQRRYGIDLWEIAAEFARLSPDRLMRETMKEAGDAR